MTSKPPLKSENSRSKIEPQKSKEELLKAKNDPQKVKNEPQKSELQKPKEDSKKVKTEPQKSELQKPKEEPKKFKVEPLKSKVEPPKSKIEQPKEVKVEAPKSKPESQKANKQKKKVEFNKTEVYLFDVREGLDAIPTTGGIPLGMEHKHHDKQEFSCTQFEKMHAVKTPQKSVDESTQSTEENPSTSPFKMKERFEPLSHDARKELFFSNNLPFDQKGIEESLEIVESRETCGCKCRFGNCMGQYCSCSANGIECQVEDDGFPCACRKGRCKNPQGRKEYSRTRIREHFFNTLADWIMTEKRKENNAE